MASRGSRSWYHLAIVGPTSGAKSHTVSIGRVWDKFSKVFKRFPVHTEALP